MSINRNDPCPCGLGKKHKQCCMRFNEETLQAAFTDVLGNILTWDTSLQGMLILGNKLARYIEEEFGVLPPTGLFLGDTPSHYLFDVLYSAHTDGFLDFVQDHCTKNQQPAMPRFPSARFERGLVRRKGVSVFMPGTMRKRMPQSFSRSRGCLRSADQTEENA